MSSYYGHDDRGCVLHAMSPLYSQRVSFKHLSLMRMGAFCARCTPITDPIPKHTSPYMHHIDPSFNILLYREYTFGCFLLDWFTLIEQDHIVSSIVSSFEAIFADTFCVTAAPVSTHRETLRCIWSPPVYSTCEHINNGVSISHVPETKLPVVSSIYIHSYTPMLLEMVHFLTSAHCVILLHAYCCTVRN